MPSFLLACAFFPLIPLQQEYLYETLVQPEDFHVGLHPLFLLKRALIPEMDNDFSKVTKFLVGRADRGDISQLCADKYCSTLFTVTHDIDWMHKN